jgi:hypothetical protein
MHKTCKTCLVEKSIAEFYKQSKRGSMGVRGSCKLCDNKVKKVYRESNKDSIAQLKKAEYERNKEHHLAQKKKYRQENKGKINYFVALRKKIVKQRTPSWLTEIDFERIRNEYRLAALQSKITGEPWHVDHIIPLQGKLVSGLHVPSNLQAIRGIDNISKKNRFEVNYAK